MPSLHVSKTWLSPDVTLYDKMYEAFHYVTTLQVKEKQGGGLGDATTWELYVYA